MGQKVNPTLFRLESQKDWKFSHSERDFNETPYHVYENLQIKKFVERFFNECNLILHTLKLRKFEGKTELLLLYHKNPTTETNTDISLKPVTSKEVPYLTPDFSQNLTEILLPHIPTKFRLDVIMQCVNNLPLFVLKEHTHLRTFSAILYSLRRHHKDTGFNDFINSVLVVVTKKDSAEFFSNTLAIRLAESKRHNSLLNLWRKSLFSLVNSPFSKIKGLKLQVKGRINGRPRAKSIKMTVGRVPSLTISSNIDYAKRTAYTNNGTFGVSVWICS